MKRGKKILVWVLLGVVVVVGVVWLWGGRTFVNVAEVRVDATPEVVFHYLIEPELLTQWMEGVEEGTGLKHTMRARYFGAVRFAAPLMGGEVQRQLDGDLARLRELVAAEESAE